MWIKLHLPKHKIDTQYGPELCQSVRDNQTTYYFPVKEESADIDEMKRNGSKMNSAIWKRTLLHSGGDSDVLNGQSAGKSTGGLESILLCYSKGFNLH